MKIICSYCKQDLGEKEPLDNNWTTHGICPKCFARLDGQFQNQTLDQYLNTSNRPMFAIDPADRVVAYNRSYVEVMLGGKRKPKNLCWGEFLNCRNSALADGCGKASECRRCSLRKLIRRTFQSGENRVGAPVDLTTVREGHFLKLRWLVSIAKVETLVHLTILDIDPPNRKPGRGES
jgi:hypothetical protein